MYSQVPFHRWGGEGIPLPVRVQLFRIGAGADACILCSQKNHGIHLCPKRNTTESQGLWAAWDKKWLLLLGQELIRYSMCSDDEEYRRRSAALFAKSPVDGASVRTFKREHGIKSTARGFAGNDGSASSKPPVRTMQATVTSTNLADSDLVGKRKQRRRNRQRKDSDTVGTRLKASQQGQMEIDADESNSRAVPVAKSATASTMNYGSPKGKEKLNVQEIRSSRGTAMTPPPHRPVQQSNGQLVPCTGPLLIPPSIGFRSYASLNCESKGRQGRSVQSSEEKSARSISASASIPVGKSVRTSADVCVPPVEARGEEEVGSSSTALVVVPSQTSRRPYEQFSLQRYVSSTSASRKLFWERASGAKKWEIAKALSRLPERDEVLQEARMEFGAEKYGLVVGGPIIELIEDEVI